MASTTEKSNILKISYLNIRGQTSLPSSKQSQIEDFVKLNNIDILHCQDIDIQEDSLNDCNLCRLHSTLLRIIA